MTSTVYVDLIGPPVNAAWLNDVNNAVYSGSLSPQAVNVFSYMTAEQIASVQARDGTQDVTAALQAFFNACKGGRGYMPPGTYYKTAQIEMDPVYSYDIEGAGWSSEYSEQGTVIKDMTGCNGLFIYYANANYPGGPAGASPSLPNSDNRVRISQMSFLGPNSGSTVTVSAGIQTVGIEGVNTVVQTGTGIWMYWTNALLLEDVWISGYPTDGLYGYRCFTAVLESVWLIKNVNSGIHFYNTANAVLLSNIKSLGNGRLPSNSINYNILIDGAPGYNALGPVINGATDVSYGGGNAAATYKVSSGTLTNIVALGGTATINATGHAFNVGNVIAITGGISTEAQINTIFAATVLTKTANSFTVATTAANATYSGTGLQVAPFVGGVGLYGVYGAELSNVYSENCTGAAIYIDELSQGFAIKGGYFQQNKIVLDSQDLTYHAQDGVIEGAYMFGYESGIYQVLAQGCVVGKNTLAGNASNYFGGAATVYKQNNGILVDGMYVGLGQWTDYQVNTNAGVGVGVLANVVTTSPTDGIHNTALGYYALNANTSAYNNTAMGYNALRYVTTGIQNTAVGSRALDAVAGINVQATTAVGFAAGSGINSGSSETNVGSAAGLRDTPSASNSNNTHIGATAGRLTNGALVGNVTIIGAQSTGYAPTSGLSNLTTLGYNTQNDALAASNTTILGNSSATTAVIHGKVRLDSAYLSSSTTNTVTNKIKVNIGGTDYYLLASTSST